MLLTVYVNELLDIDRSDMPACTERARSEFITPGGKGNRATRPGHPIHICLDNTAVIRGLLGEAAESSQAAFLEFRDCAATTSAEVRWGHEMTTLKRYR